MLKNTFRDKTESRIVFKRKQEYDYNDEQHNRERIRLSKIKCAKLFELVKMKCRLILDFILINKSQMQ